MSHRPRPRGSYCVVLVIRGGVRLYCQLILYCRYTGCGDWSARSCLGTYLPTPRMHTGARESILFLFFSAIAISKDLQVACLMSSTGGQGLPTSWLNGSSIFIDRIRRSCTYWCRQIADCILKLDIHKALIVNCIV